MPPRYFLPISTLDSCLALTSLTTHTPPSPSPSLKYLHDIFNHTAAVKMWVGPFLGLWARQGALGMGRDHLSHLLFSSSIILACLSSTGLRNPSGIFSCTNGLTTPFMMDNRVALSVTFANALSLAQTSAKCSWARAACSNIVCDKCCLFSPSGPLG